MDLNFMLLSLFSSTVGKEKYFSVQPPRRTGLGDSLETGKTSKLRENFKEVEGFVNYFINFF